MTTTRTTPTPALSPTCRFLGGCASDLPAIHNFEGTDLCAFHSPHDADLDAEATYLAGLDARNETRDLIHLATPEEPSTPAPSTYAPWFQALLNQNESCTDLDAFEHTAYRGYIAYNLSMTDGHYAPEDFDAWVIGFRKAPIGQLYWGNDARHTLAPQVNAYITTRQGTPCDGGCGTLFPDADPTIAPLCLDCAEDRAETRRRFDGRRKAYRGDTLYNRR